MHPTLHLVPIPIPILICDLQTLHFMEVNEAAIKFYGYSREEFLEMKIHDILYGDELPMMDETSTGTKKRVKHIKKGGETIHVEVNTSPYHIHGKMAELTFIHDITELLEKESRGRMAQNQLLESERRFKALVQEGSDLIAIQSLNGRSTFISDNYKSILGYEPEELLAINSFDYLHKDDKDKVVEKIQLLKSQKQVTLEPYRFPNKQKEWRWITSTITNMLDDPAIGGIVVNSKDITETIKKSDELLLTNREYKTVLRAAGEAICVWDCTRNEVDWGTTFREIFGHEIKDRSLTLWHDHIHKDDKDRVITAVNQVMKDPKQDTVSLEYRFHKATGEVALVQFRGVFLRKQSGQPLKLIASFRDITHYKESVYQLQKRNEELGEIAWTQSHKVRAPLTKIMGLIQLLEKEEPKTPAQEELLKHLNTSAAELDETITVIVKRIAAL